jgi:hypothetical protein
VEIADPWRLILSTGSGALFRTGEGRVSPQLKKASLSEVDCAEAGLVTEQIAAVSSQRVSLHQAVSGREEICIVRDLRGLRLQTWAADVLLPPRWRRGLVSSQNG